MQLKVCIKHVCMNCWYKTHATCRRVEKLPVLAGLARLAGLAWLAMMAAVLGLAESAGMSWPSGLHGWPALPGLVPLAALAS